MARNSNTSSLENLNGSAQSIRSNHTYHSVRLQRATPSRPARSTRSRRNRNHNRHHTYPAQVAEEYQYADNSAAGHRLYHLSGLDQPSTVYQDPAPVDQGPNNDQTYLLPEASFTAETYNRDLDLDEDQADTAMLSSQADQTQPFIEQRSITEDVYQDPQDSTNQDRQTNSEYEYDDYVDNSSYPSTDFGDEDGGHYLSAPSTPSQRDTYDTRPTSPTTRRYLREDAPQDCMRLGLRRYETDEDQRRAYERALRCEPLRYGSSRSAYGSTRRH